MSISRDDVIKTLDVLAGPLGPLTSLDERMERQDLWVDHGGVELLETLMALVADSPREAQLQHASFDRCRTLLIEVVGTLGKRHPEVALQRLALGEIGGAKACHLLAQLRQAAMPGQQSLRREIEIGLQAAHCE